MKLGALQIPEDGNQPNLCFGGEKEVPADKSLFDSNLFHLLNNY